MVIIPENQNLVCIQSSQIIKWNIHLIKILYNTKIHTHFILTVNSIITELH